ncbi:MAG: hypothetical protein ACREMO_01065 [Gemmatimonadales bacterium]
MTPAARQLTDSMLYPLAHRSGRPGTAWFSRVASRAAALEPLDQSADRRGGMQHLRPLLLGDRGQEARQKPSEAGVDPQLQFSSSPSEVDQEPVAHGPYDRRGSPGTGIDNPREGAGFDGMSPGLKPRLGVLWR